MIKFEIPNNPIHIKHVGEMLVTLAEDLDRVTPALGLSEATPIASECIESVIVDGHEINVSTEAAPKPPETENEAWKQITGIDAPAPPLPLKTPATTRDSMVGVKDISLPAPTPPAAEGVELADGIPWDARIHASSRKKLAKAPHGWKLIRGIDKGLVATVEAELRAAMAVQPPAAPEPPADSDTPGTVETNNPVITNFAELTQEITKRGVSQERVKEVVESLGLPGYPLLAAKPELIPAVVAQLFEV